MSLFTFASYLILDIRGICPDLTVKSSSCVAVRAPALVSTFKNERLINAPTWKNVSKSSSPVEAAALKVFDKTVNNGFPEKSSDASGIPSINVIEHVKLCDVTFVP